MERASQAPTPLCSTWNHTQRWQRCSFHSLGFQPNFCCAAWTWFFIFLHASVFLFNMKAFSQCSYKTALKCHFKKYKFKHILCSRWQGQQDLTWMCVLVVVTSARSWPWASAIKTKTTDEALWSLHSPECSENGCVFIFVCVCVGEVTECWYTWFIWMHSRQLTTAH